MDEDDINETGDPLYDPGFEYDPDATQNDFTETGCTHRCLKPDDHVEKGEPHSYGYQLGPHAADDFIPEGYMLVKKPSPNNNSIPEKRVSDGALFRKERWDAERASGGDPPKLRLLDLFCGGGGAAMGYHRAGFDEIVGVDIKLQPNYPFVFEHDDALSVLPELCSTFDLIHASPPCQTFTAYRRKGNGVGDKYPDLIAPVRELLKGTGVPYVIENVAGAPLNNSVRLCGSMFGLDVQRHRYFEASFPIAAPECDHKIWTPRFAPATNRTNLRKTVEVGVWRIPLAIQQRAMGIDWMTLPELSQAIPPAYTQLIGKRLIESMEQAA